ncbi:ATP-binding cassette domain-containing protein [Leifsonia sp. Root112D2]|uniref:ATP-binding cassette domain-containing protein n=1 Tax=Leifsonia sp. Root112D2 TaxID=1736426 RepID=UPI0006FD08AC|nr:ATP-binding cassette domain-containing protein [Leifsonia sp. Root112D2]KQV06985.1 ABC transporter [Leifsonia sp. Root112D2]
MAQPYSLPFDSSAALHAADLTKSYPGGRGKPRGASRIRALDGLSFTAETGTIFGLLGPNGAGKSTTVKILATLTRADSGSATVAGIDVARHPEQVRRAIGFVAQKQVSDPAATGTENLVLAGRLQGMRGRAARERASELLERFSLEKAARRQVKTYSGGMARKLDVAIGLMHRPQVLFLDEPTTGLDPEARAEMWAELEIMARVEQMTVLLTTHYLDEADRLASRLAIVDHGRVVAEGTPDELKNGLHGDAVIVELAPDAAVDRALAAISRVASLREISVDGRTLRARAEQGAAALPLAIAALEEASQRVASATVARPSLDDVYLRHTGRSFAVGDASANSSSTNEKEVAA